MFFRATEQSDGSGLGLYIVKQAVEKMGGSVGLTSQAGVGTTFTIRLPNRKP
jgi:signal transduction histidine kinase